jgi:hypothetical protein
MIAIDKLNLVLIILSFIAACLFPFEVFLFSYAFFGPLHYLTETNWIRDKNYFVINNYWKYLVLFSAILYSLPFIILLPFWSTILSEETISFVSSNLFVFNNVIMLFILISAIFTLFHKTYKAFIYSFLIVLLFSIWTYNTETYKLILGLFLPTIIHVYLFTIIFMVYGARKKKNIFNIINIFLVLFLPLSLIFMEVDFIDYYFSDSVKDAYLENNFHVLNANLAQLFGVYEDLKFFFYEKVDLKIQIFIAFAYLYHYLNWFSKTTIIGWHKKINNRKGIFIIALWILILMTFIYDYRLGLIVSIFFSVSHVMYEFPLNMLTIKSLFRLK